jgi:hypothetical protein
MEGGSNTIEGGGRGGWGKKIRKIETSFFFFQNKSRVA